MQPIFHNNPLISNGLVGAWGFKSAGQTANDVSANSNNGTLENDTIAQRDSSFLFDGIDDYVDLNSLNVNGNITISLWVNPSSFLVYFGVFKIGTDSNANANQKFAITGDDDGDVIFITGNGTDASFDDTGFDFILNEWQHIVCVLDGDDKICYKDSVKGSTSTNTADNIDDFAISFSSIGSLKSSANFFDGQISQVAIYDRALTEDEIKYIYKSSVPDDSLILHVDGTGKDITRFRHETTLNGDTVIGKYMEFDGSGDYVDFGNVENINTGTGDFTYNTWIKLNNNTSFQTIFAKDYFDEMQWRITSSGKMEIYIDSSSVARTSQTLLVDTWYMVSVKRTGINFKLYVNGEEDTGSSSTSSYSLNNTDPFYIGCRQGSSHFFNGNIDEARVYNRALTASEIKYMYENEKKYY